MRYRNYILLTVLFGILVLPQYAQQGGLSTGSGVDMNSLYAREEFRVGVQSYNRYSFNEAIMSFERALSYRPGEALILEWLGRSYYRSGLEETALRQWQAAAEAYGNSSGNSLLLLSRIETVRNRRSLFPFLDEDIRFVNAGSYPGRYDNIIAYRQPTAVLPLEDGSVWVVAYGSNEIVRIDVNGIIRQRSRGPLNGFDRPYDIVRGLDGRLYVSEMRGGRVSILNANGVWQSYMGERGLGAGQLVGPQNLAVDESGYVYVVDYGTRRISKFDPDGQFIMSFGARNSGFAGLLSPSGIAAGKGRVFVADGALHQIVMFDTNGMYLGALVTNGLGAPEGLRWYVDGRLLTVDANRLLLVDTDSAVIQELGLAGNTNVRITGAAADRNGNILAANFNADEVLIMTTLDDMASGLFVQIDRVISDNFPQVTLELQVQDRQRRPIVGLDARNFMITEEGRNVPDQNFLAAGYRDPAADIAIIVERSSQSSRLQNDIAAAVRDIYNATLASGAAGGVSGSGTGSRIVSLVAAGEQPFRERLDGAAYNTRDPVEIVSLAARGQNSSYTNRWRFDLAVRLAATDLLPLSKKRAVVFVTSGSLGEAAFDRYGLSELAAYLANNNIVFHAIVAGNNGIDEDIRYLCAATGGEALSLYRAEGIAPVITGLVQNPSGSYTLSYRSQLYTDFGRAYLPVEAEVYLLERSGRDATGYYPPME
ncbi:hypothetical protein FACS1894151_08250 [Spirochaetia bacterium]|nr:hypothetical protein FACS1894151_08250 [Spirochaetia bacterium]